MPNNLLWGLKGYDTGMQFYDNLQIPTLIREYYNKMKQTVHHYYRELLMKLGVIIWLPIIYCMFGGNFLILYIFQFFNKISIGSLGEKKTLFGLLQLNKKLGIFFLTNMMTLNTILELGDTSLHLRRGWLLKKKKSLSFRNHQQFRILGSINITLNSGSSTVGFFLGS